MNYSEIDNEFKVTKFVEESDTSDFPIELISGFYRKYLTEINMHDNFDLGYLFSGLLFTISVALRHRLKIRIKPTYYERPTFYIALVGKKGIAKSPALKTIMQPLFTLQSAINGDYSNELREYKRNFDKSNPSYPPIPYSLLMMDITQEKIIDALDKNNRKHSGCFCAGYYRDELIGWINDLNAYRGGVGSDEQFWLSNFNNANYIKDRKSGEPISLPFTKVDVIGTIQPEIFRKMATSKSRIDSGFLDRILLCYPASDIIPYESNSFRDIQFDKDYEKLIHSIYFLEEDVVLEYSDEAQNLYLIFSNYLTDNSNSIQVSAQDNNSKLKIYLHRIASILHLMQYDSDEIRRGKIDTQISITTVECAIKIVLFYKRQFLMAISQFLPDAKKDFEKERSLKKFEDLLASYQNSLNRVPKLKKQEFLIACMDSGWKQAELANRLGVDRSTFSKLLTK